MIVGTTKEQPVLQEETDRGGGRQQRFLEYLEKTQIPASKAAVLERNYQTIRREMERRDQWNPHGRFLDVGCGVGLYTEYWHSRGFIVSGVDAEEDLILRARTRAAVNGLSLRYETGRAERLPFEDHAFDIVFANSILEHVTDWERCLDEWVRVLAPGGLLWIETTNVLCPRQGEYRWLPVYSWWPGFLKRIVVSLARGPLPSLANYSPCPAVHWFSFVQLRQFLEARGLSVRDRFDCMDLTRVGPAKRLVRKLALSHGLGRRLAYLVVSPLVVLAARPMGEHAEMGVRETESIFGRHHVLDHQARSR